MNRREKIDLIDLYRTSGRKQSAAAQHIYGIVDEVLKEKRLEGCMAPDLPNRWIAGFQHALSNDPDGMTALETLVAKGADLKDVIDPLALAAGWFGMNDEVDTARSNASQAKKYLEKAKSLIGKVARLHTEVKSGWDGIIFVASPEWPEEMDVLESDLAKIAATVDRLTAHYRPLAHGSRHRLIHEGFAAASWKLRALHQLSDRQLASLFTAAYSAQGIDEVLDAQTFRDRLKSANKLYGVPNEDEQSSGLEKR